MDKLSHHIGKTIIDITSAEELGKLSNITISDSAITHFMSTDNKAIATGDIVSIADYIAVKNCDIITNALHIATPIGGSALCTSGKLLGIISDYEFTKGFMLKRVLCDNIGISANKISAFNASYMIFNSNYCAKQPKAEYSVQNIEAAPTITKLNTVPTQPIVSDDCSQMSSGTPQRPPVSDYSFLVGRIITRDIYLGQKRLFCSGNTITDSIVSNAKIYNKLVDLTLYSQKNNIS